jgi:hypothetical protein
MKNSTSGIAILAMAACALWAPTAAASGPAAWRCGNTYSDRPCPDGKPLALDDARDAAQKRDADRTIREAQSAGDRLERERLRQEKAQAGRQPTLIDSRPAAPKPEADSAKKKKKGKKEPDYFSAHDPVATAKKKAEKAGKAARRSAEKS